MARQREVARWVTIDGNHVPIFKGESLGDATNRKIAEQNEAKKEKDIQRNKEEADKLNGKDSKGKENKSKTGKGDKSPEIEIVFTPSRFARKNDFYAWWDQEIKKAREEWQQKYTYTKNGKPVEDDMSRINFLYGGLGSKPDMSGVIAEFEKATGQKLSDEDKRKIGFGMRKNYG